jgi:hypothetical protein
MAILSTLRPSGIFYGILVPFVVIWYIFPVLLCCTEKNLATLFPATIGTTRSLPASLDLCLCTSYLVAFMYI